MTIQRLLILDDDPMTGATIQTIAEFAGLEVQFTLEPDTFFALVESWQPDHIALDLVMPQMDGVQVLAALAQRQCRARIIITSGVSSRVLEAAGRSAIEHGLNISGVLPKPFTPAALRQLLTQAPDTAVVALAVAPAATPDQLPALSPADLEDALRLGQINLCYQPKITCRNGSLAGFEALARWQHPQRGLISPDTFIPLAEQHGLIDQLTEQVAEQALTWLAQLQLPAVAPATQLQLDKLAGDIRLSLNISARSLSNLALFQRLTTLCQTLGVAPQRLILELTETSAMDDPVLSLDILTRLRMKGFQLSIDDFGTGYSSMLQLVRLPFSEIKVDKSFVMTARDSQESRTVIKSIVDLGHSLGLQTTAEGIEDKDAFNYLREIGCDLAQGYFIARPMPATAVPAWIQQLMQSRERERLDSLYLLDILDTPAEERFDRLTRLAKRLFKVPIVLISLVDECRQWFKSAQGLDVRETPRDVSFCSHAVQEEALLLVPDATLDPRFCNNPLVQQPPGIRFYAGALLRAPDGNLLGTFCLIDTVPRTLSASEQQLLEDLARMAEHELVSDRLISTDHLTGLLNRQAFESRAEEALTLARHQRLGLAILFFDLNEFKAINDTCGHQAGDAALTGFAGLLRTTWRESDLVARLGGDEFVVLLMDTAHTTIDKLLHRLQQALMSYNSNSGSPPLSFSVGISLLQPGDTTDLQTLLDQADQNMYAAKLARGE